MATNPSRWSFDRRIRVDELFGVLVAAPEGLTIYDIAEELGVSVPTARNAVRDLRIVFGQDSDINLTAQPRPLMPWLYQLTGSYEQARPWVTNRLGDLESRLETIEAVSGSIARGAPEGTFEQRRAQEINRTIGDLRNRLVAIEADRDG